MMHRSVAMADAKTVRRRDGSADKGLGVADGGYHVLAFGKSGRDGRGQRAAGAVGVFGGDAWRWQREGAVACREVVDTLGALPVTALDQDGAATQREQPLALALDDTFVHG